MTELLFRDDAYLQTCSAAVVALHGNAIELDRTVFYPAGGGQPGDSGRIAGLRVADARKGENGERVLHVLEAGAPLPPPGTAVEVEIDWERRYRHMRFHTALHLLCAVVHAPVTGGRIAADKARHPATRSRRLGTLPACAGAHCWHGSAAFLSSAARHTSSIRHVAGSCGCAQTPP